MLRNGGHGMTSIGAISSGSYITATTATQGRGTQGVRHHHRQANAADPDGDGDTSAVASGSGPASSAASLLSSALNTTA
jgi:ribosomal protein L3